MDGIMHPHNNNSAVTVQEEVKSKPELWINVLPLSLHFIDKMNQDCDLTVFKRCSHRPAEVRERRKIKLFPYPKIPQC